MTKFIAPSKLVISTEGVIGLRPTQGDEKRREPGHYFLWHHNPLFRHPEETTRVATWKIK